MRSELEREKHPNEKSERKEIERLREREREREGEREGEKPMHVRFL